MENIEIEYKVMLHETDFIKVLEYFKSKYFFNHFIQTNYYYDTKDEKLSKNGVSLRIRNYETDDKFVVTLKENLKVGKLEHEFDVPSNNVNCFPDEIANIILKNNVELNELINTSQLTTERFEFKYNMCNLCFDISSYYGLKDYEIECEASSMEEAKETILSILSPYGIEFEKSKLTKLGRAKKYKPKNI